MKDQSISKEFEKEILPLIVGISPFNKKNINKVESFIQSKISEAIAIERKELMDKVERMKIPVCDKGLGCFEHFNEGHFIGESWHNLVLDQILSLLKDENSH